jgi:hypothetical protein
VQFQRFQAVLEVANNQGGRFVRCPFDARDVFGEARPPVEGTVNGHPFRSRLMRYGGLTYLGFTREVRTAAGVTDGAVLDIELDRDEEPREVVVPAELATALAAAADAAGRFDDLSFSHRREYAQWVDQAVRPATRSRRAAKAVEMLRVGVPHP